MQTIEEFLGEFRRLEIKLWAEGDRLRFRAPEGALSPALRSQLAARKVEILEFLHKANAATSSNLPRLLPVSREGNLPLSFAQERVWFLEQLESGSSVYNLALAFRFTGVLNREAIEQSLKEIIRRHEILRTTFPSKDGQPVPAISPEIAFMLPVVELQKMPPNQREAEAQRLLVQEAQQGFDLTKGPLWRVKLLCLGAEEHWFLFTMHHIVSDGWSLTVFLRELSALYTAFCSHQSSPLPELPVQYADFASWQRQWLQGEVVESQLAYWQQQMSGVTPLQVPAERQPTVQTYRGARQSLVLPHNLSNALKSLSQQEDATLFMTLLAAFQTLLYRYTGQEDIILCSPVAGRNQPETEGLIGYFNNILPLRTNLSGNPSFRQLLGRVRQVAKGAYEHQDVPLQKIAELPNLLRTPLTRGMFALQNAPSQALSLTDIGVSSLDVHNGTANFDLSLFVEEKGETVKGLLDYKSDLFNDAAIAKMLENFQTLLESIVANPDLKLKELPSFTVAKTDQLCENNHSSTSCIQERQPIFVPPRNELELTLVKIWEKVLDIQPIGIRDNFFTHLGGSSLLAAKLFAEIEKAFNKNLPLATLVQSPTIEQQANLLSQKEELSTAWSLLVPIQTGGSKPPLFCIHAVGGNVLTYVALARHLGLEQPVYGIQAQGIDGKGSFQTSLEEMATNYIKAIRTVQPEGPYFLGGLSGGGTIAFEMAQQLYAQGDKVAILALFDSYNPEYLRERCIADDKYRRENFSIKRSILERLNWYRHLQNNVKRVLRVWSHFAALESQEKSSYILEKTNKLKEKTLQKLELISYKLDPRPGRPLPYLMREAAITNNYMKVLFDYVPKVYPGKVTLFRASEGIFMSSEGSDTDELGWDKVAAGGLEIYKIPGDHASLVAEPNVRLLSSKLSNCIDRSLLTQHQSLAV